MGRDQPYGGRRERPLRDAEAAIHDWQLRLV